MSRVSYAEAAEVVDPLLTLVVDHFTPEAANTVPEYRRAGEFGAVIGAVVRTADEHHLELPIENLQVVADWLSRPREVGFFSPVIPLDDLVRSVNARLAAASSPSPSSSLAG